MKKIIFCITILLSLNISIGQISYPKTEKRIVTDDYHGTTIDDPFRWLEDDKSPEVSNWIKSQNELTFSYLNNISEIDTIKKRLQELWNYEKTGTPFVEGKYTYFYKNDGLQNQYVLYRKRILMKMKKF